MKLLKSLIKEVLNIFLKISNSFSRLMLLCHLYWYRPITVTVQSDGERKWKQGRHSR